MQLSFDLSTPQPPKNPSPEIWSVKEVTSRIKRLLETSFRQLWVQGEISNLRKQTSGHYYFTLKDATSQLSCVLFAKDAKLLRSISLSDGQEIQVAGEISVYEARGNYQLIVRHVQTRGTGALQALFEALKKQLESEGLFDSLRKRPLPKYPRRIGIVTSPTGAALHDFLNVLWRRNPQIEVIIHASRVQGAGACHEIANAIRQLNQLPSPAIDVIVLTRGGGSIEDLWEFNEEVVARAIAASRIPIISAIGHEIDFTISDFTADLRAPTPSAAAEILATEAEELRAYLTLTSHRMSRICSERIKTHRNTLQQIQAIALFRRPDRILQAFYQKLDRHCEDLQNLIDQRITKLQDPLNQAIAILRAHHPDRWIAFRQEKLHSQIRRWTPIADKYLRTTREKIDHLNQLLRSFDPAAILGRGFTLTFDEKGNLLKSVSTAQQAKTVITRFADGEIATHSPEIKKT